jgi:hypothetical protein
MYLVFLYNKFTTFKVFQLLKGYDTYQIIIMEFFLNMLKFYAYKLMAY